MKNVLIVQKTLPNYRVAFFNGLKNSLEKKGIKLTLIYGNPSKKNSLKKDEAKLDWAIKIENSNFNLGPVSLIWQPALKYIKDQDLIICEQANKLLLNYFLISFQFLYKYKFAYWGHGRNMQATKNNPGNIFKKHLTNKTDWWFAYTEGVKSYLMKEGISLNKITVVQNAVNTNEMNEDLLSISREETESLKADYKITGSNIGIYCGGIYEEKRIDFLIQACDLIKKEIPDFHFFVLGGGNEAYKIKKAASEREWLHYIGPLFGKSKIKYFKLAKVFLMPGLVGLAVLDSFATFTPMITTAYPYHSPEIEYLKDGYNGVISENDIDKYVVSVVQVFKNRDYQNQLVKGCQESFSQYTVEKMVENFSKGIVKCLQT